jgi:hypothetical protein
MSKPRRELGPLDGVDATLFGCGGPVIEALDALHGLRARRFSPRLFVILDV